ncbi:hypothetical protein [Williamsia maris]|uniref:Uncharacterized protein n=1 Tax=Williamsia maris TaxID=72806 RepID=A0ABT1HBW7_9NOCA|nr:hypothetical protein [Williamsia maris]MCP2174465.1 hypothetical protein [Williamsia maris]
MRWRRNPVVGLFFLAPLIAEFFLGDFPIYLLPLILPLSLWYGAGAVMIREVTRRLDRGWPTILLLGLAFGVAEEGLLTMSLFNPDYADLRLLDSGHIAALGIGLPWTIFVLSLHVLWSVAAPIALIEEAQPDRRTTPWLSNRALTVIGVLLVLGAGVTFATNYPAYGDFLASPAQLVTCAVIVAALVALAVNLPRSQSPTTPGRFAPSAWSVAGVVLVCAGAFQVAGHTGIAWVAVPGMVVSLAVLGASVAWWSRSAEWTANHRLAVAAGLVLTYTWRAFFGGYGTGAGELVVSLVSYVVYAIAAVTILIVCSRRIGRAAEEIRTSSPSARRRHRRRSPVDATAPR